MPLEIVKTWGGRKVQVHLPPLESPIEELPSPDQVILPLSEGHFQCRPLVEVGEIVYMGEIIARDDEWRMAPVHSPVSGKVIDIRPFRFTEYGSTLSIFIESDGKDEYRSTITGFENFMEQDPVSLIKIIRDAGVKLIPYETLPEAERKGSKITSITKFVINAIGHGFSEILLKKLIVDRVEDLKKGVQLIKKIWNPEKIYLVTDNGDQEIYEKVIQSNLESVEIVQLNVVYPLGHPHLLFKELFNNEIPSPNGKAIDFGVAFSGVDTILHAVDAVTKGKPLMERYVTVSGNPVGEGKNLKVRIGTPVKSVIEYLGYLDTKIGKIVFGNPMDGTAQVSLESPVLKDTRWIWIQSEDEITRDAYRACINCGDCVDVCPMRLMPNLLGRYCEFYRFEDAQELYDLFTCIECGLCAYVCPSRRPLVHFIKHAKHELIMMREEENEG